MAEVDLTLLARVQQQILDELRAMRRDTGDQRRESADLRRLSLDTLDDIRRFETRIDSKLSSLRDDLELMIRSKVMGRIANFETSYEVRLDEIADALEQLGADVERLKADHDTEVGS